MFHWNINKSFQLIHSTRQFFFLYPGYGHFLPCHTVSSGLCFHLCWYLQWSCLACLPLWGKVAPSFGYYHVHSSAYQLLPLLFLLEGLETNKILFFPPHLKCCVQDGKTRLFQNHHVIKLYHVLYKSNRDASMCVFSFKEQNTAIHKISLDIVHFNFNDLLTS